jgi:hypothetical protein
MAANNNQNGRIPEPPILYWKARIAVTKEAAYLRVLKKKGVQKYSFLSYPCLMHCKILYESADITTIRTTLILFSSLQGF